MSRYRAPHGMRVEVRRGRGGMHVDSVITITDPSRELTIHLVIRPNGAVENDSGAPATVEQVQIVQGKLRAVGDGGLAARVGAWWRTQTRAAPQPVDPPRHAGEPPHELD